MDLRTEYIKLRFYSECPIANPALADEVIKVKRKIRECNNRVSDRKIVRDYGINGYVLLIELPDTIRDEKNAVEYFEAVEYIPMYYSAYDCTGRAFTNWYKIIKRRGKFFAYHRVSFDV